VTDPELAVELSWVGERTIQIDRVLPRSLAAGTGPPPGGGARWRDSAGDWSAVLALLGRTPQVLAPDRPGDSPASPPGSRLLPGAAAGFVARFLEVVGLDRVAVAGSSLGGLAALQLALSNPEIVVGRRRPGAAWGGGAGGVGGGAFMAGAPVLAGRAGSGRSPPRVPGGQGGQLRAGLGRFGHAGCCASGSQSSPWRP
jgi:pimeloyl-ACP methyl ester carboxylesterase